MAADAFGYAQSQIEAVEGRERLDASFGSRRRLQQPASVLLLAEQPLRECLRGFLADQDLTSFGGSFHLDRSRDARPGQEQLAMRVAD
jgi:hypothetical protein